MDTQPSSKNVQDVQMGSSQLLAALSFATDVVPGGCYYHSWRVALVSQLVASTIAPDIQRDVFYAGLLLDAGAVGATRHITQYASVIDQFEDLSIRSHPQRGCALLGWLPGMDVAAQFVRSHHEWWNGRGYPDRTNGQFIPLGAQILGIVSAADIAGCFSSSASLRTVLPGLSGLTGQAWSQEMWAGFVRSTQNAAFYRALTDLAALPGLMTETLSQLPPPEALDNEEGVERVLHLFAALIDLKDPSTSGHSMRTARRAQVLATQMKLSEDEARTAYRAGLVHDIGRLGVDTCILNKSGRLSDKEMEAARGHSEMTIHSLSCLPGCQEMATLGHIAGHDHERFDGTGYPDGLAGEKIPIISRILSAVDAYDAMVASKEYRLLTSKGAVVRLEQGAGTQFDPAVAKAMVSAVNDELFEEIPKAA